MPKNTGRGSRLGQFDGSFAHAKREGGSFKPISRRAMRAMTDEWRAAGVNPPTPRRSITMPATSPAKAILAALAAAIASFLATVQGRTDLASMKAIDWIIVLLSAAVTGVGVYLVPNKPTGTRRNELGQGPYLGWAIGLVVLVILVIVLLRIA